MLLFLLLFFFYAVTMLIFQTKRIFQMKNGLTTSTRTTLNGDKKGWPKRYDKKH